MPDYVRLVCERVVRAKSCVNGFVRQVPNIDVQPLQSCVRLMCNTRRLMCQRIVRAKSCLNGFVRQVSIIDVQPLRSCVGLMCNTRR